MMIRPTKAYPISKKYLLSRLGGVTSAEMFECCNDLYTLNGQVFRFAIHRRVRCAYLSNGDISPVMLRPVWELANILQASISILTWGIGLTSQAFRPTLDKEEICGQRK